MGYRIHVAEVYQVKHSSDGHFSNHSAEINRMLCENCPDLVWEGDNVESSERLEVPRNELAVLISKIVTYRDDFDKWLKLHNISECVDDFIRIVAGWIARSDQRNDFVVLSWH